MGGAQSRGGLTGSREKRSLASRLSKGRPGPAASTGYFMLSFKGDRVKVVNADSGELKLLTAIIRRHCQILKEGWDRHLTFSYRLKVAGRHCMIQLVADTLLSLYQAGWEPMTPMDMGLRREHGVQTTICFKRKEGNSVIQQEFNSSMSSLLRMSSSEGDNSCLCLEIFQSNFLGFHDTSNTVLHELVTTIQRDWTPGIRGVSMGVASVISDYTRDMPAVLPQHPQLRDEKYIQLEGRPWEQGHEDPVAKENLQRSIISCLARERYKLSMDINMDNSSTLFFFIRDSEEQSGEVRAPHMLGSVHPHKLTRSGSRPEAGGRVLARRKLGGSHSTASKKSFSGGVGEERSRGAEMSHAPPTSCPAWWQQTSTDVGSDQEDGR